jgi:predicted aldo/keto reductase-like oxidoreductase
MQDEKFSRRRFMRDAAVGAAGITVGLSAAQRAAAKRSAKRKKKILNYNPEMEYRRLGKTELMVSAVCMGGHWKRVDKVLEATGKENCHDVVSRCIDVGINYIDACCISEVCAYSKALTGRRDKMYLALSGGEVRNKNYRTAKKLMERLDSLLKKSNQEYTDLWRITCLEPGGRHTFNTACEIAGALEKAKKQGKARFGGFSTHDRRWIKFMIEYFPQIDVVVFPYMARTKRLPKDSVFDALAKCDVGAFGIKPFASNSLFKGSSAPDDPHAQEDDKRARLAIRYILCNPHIIPIPGLISGHQVDNVAKAVMERRKFDLVEATELEKAMDETWAKLPRNYQWLKDWEYV